MRNLVSRRVSVTFLSGLVASGVIASLPVSAATSSKRALCIGNANYRSRPLRNPVNDARSVGSALKELGFDVTLLSNASKAEMRNGFRSFFDQSKETQIVFIFYAGHGFEVGGTNYLIPVDVDIGDVSTADIAELSVSLRTITSELERSKNRVRVVVVDACRDSPKRGGAAGMQQMEAKGALLAFSTSPGFLAEDSMPGMKTGNSPYTFALSESLRNKELTLKEMFNRAHNTVAALTQDRQIPWVHDGMTGDVRLYDSKVTLNSAAFDRSRLATFQRRPIERGGVDLTEYDGSPSDSSLHKDEDGRFINARERLIQKYGTAEPDRAAWGISQVDLVLVKLFIDAGISFGILDSRYSVNQLLRPIISKHQQLPDLISMLAVAGIDLNKVGSTAGAFNTFEKVPPRLIELTKKFEVGRVSGTGLRALAGQALPMAVWYGNAPAVEALIKAGVSVDTPVFVFSNGLTPSDGMTQVSTVRDEMTRGGLSSFLRSP